jgi:hypothetical protein
MNPTMNPSQLSKSPKLLATLVLSAGMGLSAILWGAVLWGAVLWGMPVSSARAQDAAPAATPQQDTTKAQPTKRGNKQQRAARRRAAEAEFTQLLGENYKQLWQGYQSGEWPKGWEVVDGVLHRSGPGEDLITVEQFGSFELRFQWKVAPGANSGVMFRVSRGDAAPYLTGPEYQILDNERHADGKQDLTSAGSLYAMYAPAVKTVKPAGEWNQSRIVIRGQRVRFFLNGKQVVDATIGSDEWNKRLAASKFATWEKFAKNSRGHLCIQDHGDEVWFRRVRVKSLD